jgi:uncharacterized protein with PQ loop repeat
MDVALWSGIAAATLSGTFSLFQVWHIAKERTTAGLSDTSWLLLTLSFSAWFIWGVLQRDPYLIGTNSASLAGSLWVLISIHREQRIKPAKLLKAAAAVTVAFVLQVAGGVAGALVAVFAITAVIRARQKHAVRSATDIGGVALSPWVISSVAQVVWFVHGVTAEKFVLTTHAPFAIATNVALLLAVHARRAELATQPRQT